MSDKFTMTETANRLRDLFKQAQEYADSKRNKFEIGDRTQQDEMHALTLDEARELKYGPDPAKDDVTDWFTINDCSSEDVYRTHGAIVHLYVYAYEPGDGWYLERGTICVGWMGTPDHDPILLDHDGMPCV